MRHKKKVLRKRTFLIIILCLLGCPRTVPCQLINHDFETGTIEPWENPASHPDQWDVTDTRSHNGQYSVRTSTEDSGGVFVLTQHVDPPIPVSSISRLSYWYFASSDGSPNLAVGFEFSDGSYDQDLVWQITLHGWTLRDATDTLMQHAGASLETIHFFDTLDTLLWIDDVELACDHDGDGYDSTVCSGDDCDDTNAQVNPGIPESGPLCSNETDDDCDGLIDSGDPDCSTPSWGPATQTGVLVPDIRSGWRSGTWNTLTVVFLPLGTFVFLKMRRRKS